MTKKEQSLSELGIYGLVNYVNEKVRHINGSTLQGIGDDASVLDLPSRQIMTNTLLLEGIHFDLVYHPLQHLGYKSVVASILDIYAMNGKPEQVYVSVGLSNKMDFQRVDQLIDGVLSACQTYGIDLAGFRPTASLTGLTISVTSSGTAEPSDTVLRKTANPTDLICVSGDLGGALMGLHLLEREKRVLKGKAETEPDFGNNDYVLKRQLKPEVPLTVFDFFRKNQISPTSMVSVKEGLATSALLMCEAAKVGCHIYENKIPLNQNTLKAANELNFNPLVAALNGGEDYELLFTISFSDFEKIGNQFPEGITAIGYVADAEKGRRLITSSDEEIDLTAQGWGTTGKKS
ncbi:thiamine-phosphate kinase [Alkalitalea saponilacus]|uniref:Thiamine-monophosphate kinase n=1 Tax=Alkalitalea saponilacus TaxID=889453 RepID=A0A1T5BYV4_9BACT|nr:thiamine-phosphate kinase [Alkalitalea saponilacus]ASB49536.1 thiamine-phosphate kinase [Alkalitalea saponilacus]SKB52315.1 thiamine-monophosphate kinase [Alkalitalea saponilacus]